MLKSLSGLVGADTATPRLGARLQRQATASFSLSTLLRPAAFQPHPHYSAPSRCFSDADTSPRFTSRIVLIPSFRRQVKRLFPDSR
jgi:hypothetical protein